MRLDSASSYASCVAGKDLFKASTSLKGNKMYSAADVGEQIAGKQIGPKEFVRFHNERQAKVNGIISMYRKGPICHVVTMPDRAFGVEVGEEIPASIRTFERDALSRLAARTLPKGYLTSLLNSHYFQQWMRISLKTPTSTWFTWAHEETASVDGMKQFNAASQKVANKLFQFTVKAMLGRRNDESSYEFDLHHFHRSGEFDKLCWESLPGRLAANRAGCVVWCLSMAKLHSSWLKEALLDSRKARNPELFLQKDNVQITKAEENSEVNRFVGWAIASAKDKFKMSSRERDDNCWAALRGMMVREGDIDDEYLFECYDINMAVMNRGGLTLVDRKFFNWAKQVMSVVRQEYTVQRVGRDPKHSFAQKKRLVMSNRSLFNLFRALFRKHSLGSDDSCDKVFKVILSKTIHARFGVVWKKWTEMNVKKNHQVDFRTKLKAASSMKSEKKRKTEKDDATPMRIEKKNALLVAKGKARMKGGKLQPFSLDSAVNRKRAMDRLSSKRNRKRKRTNDM
ncbi:hypothetical protein ACHAWF_004856 [Thalassiosira exigua]